MKTAHSKRTSSNTSNRSKSTRNPSNGYQTGQKNRTRHQSAKNTDTNSEQANHKHLLVNLWQDWLYEVRYLKSDKNWPALDKWLKNWFKQQARLPIELQSELTQACYDIFRQLQCIYFLEHCFQLSLEQEKQEAQEDQASPSHNIIIDEIEIWDRQWDCRQVDEISAERFVAWFAILKPECNLAQHLVCSERRAWKQTQFDQSLQAHPEANLINLIFMGIRPTWQPLLTQRQLISKWTDNTLNDFIQCQASMPPLWLRADPAQYQALRTSLYKQGVKVELDDNGLMAVGGRGVNQTTEYKQGLVEIQDFASQQIAASVKVKSGQKVWDCCAGAGGKSLAIASKMNNKGSIVATDLHSYKLDELKRRTKRAQLHNVRTFTWDGESALRLPNDVARQKGFDWVLVDAPCSSSGTWRRNPDAKWRFNQADTDELVKIQSKILANAAEAVRQSGYLVYATCSWQVAENEAQVADFLKNNPEFKLVEQTMLGAPSVNSDVMFVAKLQKL